MMVSALGSMVGAIAQYANRSPDNEEQKDTALMELRNACYVVAGGAQVAGEIAGTRRGWVENLIENGAGLVPGGGGQLAEAVIGMFSGELAGAVIGDEASRVQRIRRVVRRKVAQLEQRERASNRDRGAPFSQTEVLNVVDSALAERVED
jgi:hypothetical protein